MRASHRPGEAWMMEGLQRTQEGSLEGGIGEVVRGGLQHTVQFLRKTQQDETDEQGEDDHERKKKCETGRVVSYYRLESFLA